MSSGRLTPGKAEKLERVRVHYLDTEAKIAGHHRRDRWLTDATLAAIGDLRRTHIDFRDAVMAGPALSAPPAPAPVTSVPIAATAAPIVASPEAAASAPGELSDEALAAMRPIERARYYAARDQVIAAR